MSEHHNRRTEDRPFYRARNIANVILLWASVFSLFAAGVAAFVRTQEAIKKVPKLEDRVSEIESYRKRDDDRWEKLFEWTDKIERRIDRLGRGNGPR